MKSIYIILLYILLNINELTGQNKKDNQLRPNIILILADDMGYGDVSCLNENSKIQTENIDRIGKEGIIFTDAHSSGSVCTPTRYGILTGRYCWRTELKQGTLHGAAPHLIDPKRVTLSTLLKSFGYNTAIFGKWHLGMDYPTYKNENVYFDIENVKSNVKWNDNIINGPIDYGFDRYFGIPSSLDLPPFIYVNDNKFLEEADSVMTIFTRTGLAGKNFMPENVLENINDSIINYLSNYNESKPFFIYYPLTAPHTPILPIKEFKNKSGIHEYLDFCLSVDWIVGTILDLLEEKKIEDNTIVIFTSDNGFANYVDESKEMEKRGHNSRYIYRGYKGEVYEGGHRVPLLIRWPNIIKKNQINDQLVCLNDLYATILGIIGMNCPINAGEDSYNIAPYLFNNQSDTIRKSIVHSSVVGIFGFRYKDWKLIYTNNGKELYNLKEDPSEKNNLYSFNINKANELEERLNEIIETGRSNELFDPVTWDIQVNEKCYDSDINIGRITEYVIDTLDTVNKNKIIINKHIMQYCPNEINTNTGVNSIMTYPNPASKFTEIKDKDVVKIKIYNSNGILIKETANKNIDVTNYPGGIYFLQVFKKDNSILFGKIIVY